MAAAIATRRRNAIAEWSNQDDAQFAETIRKLRTSDAALFDDLTFQFHSRFELDLRLLGQVVKLRA